MTDWRNAATAAVIAAAMLLSHGATTAWGETAGVPPTRPIAKPVTARAKCDPAAFRVILDVGHTAEVPGAKSARGAFEYEFNLRLAKAIERDLLAGGFTRTVLMVTAEPPRRGLFKRVAYATDLTGDLFLSVHHDSVPDSFLEKWEFEGQERFYCDRFSGHSIFIANVNGARNASLLFGRLLGLQLKARGLRYTPHYTQAFMGHRRRDLLDAEAGVYRYDQLVVLKETRMPAVLLEAGSIINRDEELLLMTPERQSVISAAVTDAVKAFCASRAPRPPQVARRALPSHAATKATDLPAAAQPASALPSR
ncbi:MAG TPA: N-acetylmuramoyl-L-alanine amidase [Rhodoplanes sp.]|nr:N-acetylmuramoyl-L-alanine amidase [Rhodoplanes sp.]